MFYIEKFVTYPLDMSTYKLFLFVLQGFGDDLISLTKNNHVFLHSLYISDKSCDFISFFFVATS